jgi:hypothetical protein
VKNDDPSRPRDFDEESLKRLGISRTWTIAVEPLPRSPGGGTTVVRGKRGDRIKVDLPRSDRPYRIDATVDLAPNDSRIDAAQIRQTLWTDRLKLDASRMEGWIEEMSHLCDAPVRSRAAEARAPSETPLQQLPTAMRNLLSEAGRRGEVTMTTLAMLADLKRRGCPAPTNVGRHKSLLR